MGEGERSISHPLKPKRGGEDKGLGDKDVLARSFVRLGDKEDVDCDLHCEKIRVLLFE